MSTFMGIREPDDKSTSEENKKQKWACYATAIRLKMFFGISAITVRSKTLIVSRPPAPLQEVCKAGKK